MGDHHRRKGRRSLLEPGRLTFAKPIPPSEQLLRSKTMTASDSRNHDPVLAALRDDRQLLFVSPIPTALNAGDHFDPRPSRGLGFKSTVNLMVKSMVLMVAHHALARTARKMGSEHRLRLTVVGLVIAMFDDDLAV